MALAEIAARRAANRRRTIAIATLVVAVLAVGFAIWTLNTHEAPPAAAAGTGVTGPAPIASAPGAALSEPSPNMTAPAIVAEPTAAPAPTSEASADTERADAAPSSDEPPASDEKLTEEQAISHALATGRATSYGSDEDGGSVHVRDEPSQDGRPCKAYMAVEDEMPTAWSTVCRGDDGRWEAPD